MQPYSLTFFYLTFVFIFLSWIVVKSVSPKLMVYFSFFATGLYLYFAYRSNFFKLVTVALFYLLLIKLASILKNVPRVFFVLVALIPLFIFKLSDLFPALTGLNSQIAFVGISYVSFRVVQILLDIQISQPQNYLGVFVFLFNPITLLAGPIDRYYRFEENFKNISSELDQKSFLQGWYLLCFGVLQKFILAYFWDLLTRPKVFGLNQAAYLVFSC